ncbi:hypothetical protein CVT25_015839 [Psilocybe cyanescens]|uniref:Uncharacterized protein n=1 Tax=Psilocybe cyanescens TaxID=93625 RepID=A0A409XTC1_PSICY|nr:hypothetical protein CVT25_015839 [Psilocybe cyanescens]
MPLVSQSDPGSENYGIAKAHTTCRNRHDPSLSGTIQHRWMLKKKNIKPEISWSQMRQRFTPGFEDLLEAGVVNDWYDINCPLDLLVFRWIFIPFLQKELDAWADRINNSCKHANHNKILPHGIHVEQAAIDYVQQEFAPPEDPVFLLIHVEQAAIDYVQQEFAPPEDPVFLLVPPKFKNMLEFFMRVWEAQW